MGLEMCGISYFTSIFFSFLAQVFIGLVLFKFKFLADIALKPASGLGVVASAMLLSLAWPDLVAREGYSDEINGLKASGILMKMAKTVEIL